MGVFLQKDTGRFGLISATDCATTCATHIQPLIVLLIAPLIAPQFCHNSYKTEKDIDA